MTTVCYHHRAEKANICAMFLSYQCFRERWRSLGVRRARTEILIKRAQISLPTTRMLPPEATTDQSRNGCRWLAAFRHVPMAGVQLGYCCRSALSLIIQVIAPNWMPFVAGFCIRKKCRGEREQTSDEHRAAPAEGRLPRHVFALRPVQGGSAPPP